PGGIIVVTKGEDIIYSRSYGMEDLSTGRAVSDSTLFNLSSSTKTVSTAALMKLCEEGQITLDDPLSDYFPEFPDEIFRKIKIRDILSQTSGLPDLRPRTAEEWDAYTRSNHSIFSKREDYRLYSSDNEHLPIFRDLTTSEYEPGTRFQRNDPAYILVAPLVERVTGQTYLQWITENLFEPVGIKDVRFPTPERPVKNAAHAYRRAEGPATRAYRSPDNKWEEYDYGEVEFFLSKSERSMYCTARDYIKWNHALNTGRIINDSSLTMIYTPAVDSVLPDVSYGLGIALNRREGYPMKAYHMNSNGGYTAVTTTWPGTDMGYIILSNRNDWDYRSLTARIDSIIIANGYFTLESPKP
ncbi:MAG: beta-lactamase family protein, partial [Muribaculaceae bacterium]|nr:beta-lactamase family protein [Muribaculaceae bacterium]